MKMSSFEDFNVSQNFPTPELKSRSVLAKSIKSGRTALRPTYAVHAALYCSQEELYVVARTYDQSQLAARKRSRRLA